MAIAKGCLQNSLSGSLFRSIRQSYDSNFNFNFNKNYYHLMMIGPAVSTCRIDVVYHIVGVVPCPSLFPDVV